MQSTATTDIPNGRDALPNGRDALLGVLLGVVGLVSIAGILNFVDPHLRDSDGLVFSLAGVLRLFELCS